MEEKKSKIRKVLTEPVLFMKSMLFIMLLINFPYIGSIMRLIMKVMPVWGGIIFIFNLRQIRKVFKEKFYPQLALMAFTYGITILINCKFNLIQNLKSWIWYIIYIGILLIWWRIGNRNSQELCRDIKQINWFIIIINLTNVLSCMIFLIGNTYIIFQSRVIGFFGNRLYGIVDGVNPSMMIGFISVIASAMNKKIDEKPLKIKNVIYILNLVFTYISIIASGSRSVRYVMIVLIAFFLVMVLWKKWDADKYLADIKKAVLVSAFWGVLFLFVTIAVVEVTRYPIGWIPAISQSLKGGATEESYKKNEPMIRSEEAEKESTNVRLNIWKECVALWRKHLLFGVGNANYTESTHSMPVALLVYSGIVGTIVFAGYLIRRMLTGFLVLLKNSKNMDSIWYRMLFSYMICLALCLYSIFATLIIFSNVENTILFWVYLGIMEEAEYRMKYSLIEGAENE